MVRQNEKVVITRFGRARQSDYGAGLIREMAVARSSRSTAWTGELNFYEVRLSEALTKDRRNIIIPVFIAWKVDEPLKFLEAMGNPDNAKTSWTAW